MFEKVKKMFFKSLFKSANAEAKLINLTNLLLDKYRNVVGKHQENLPIAKIFDLTVDYYESIIGCMPGNVYWLDINGIAMGCNKNVLEMFGFKSVEEFKGLTFEKMGVIGNWLPETMQSFKEDTLEVIKTGKAKLNVEEPPIPHSNGKTIYFLTSRVPLFDPKGQVIGVVGISVDITERKKMELELKDAKERAEIANNAKTEFLENMRHDIRTPLSGIVGASELLNTEKESNKIKKYTNQIAEGSRELLRFLNEILESINVSTGELPLLKKKFQLRKIIENVIKLHRPKAIEKQLELKFYFDELIPSYLIGDPVRIYRILLELLVNALKFTKEGSIKVSVKLFKKTERDVVIEIAVEDTGPGIPAEKQQELFVRFKRLTPTYQGIFKGSGLGLSIAKQFIDDLEGEIYVENRATGGAKFTFYIPLKESLSDNAFSNEQETYVWENNFTNIAEEKTSGNRSTKAASPSKARSLILLVEDHLMMADIAKIILSNLQCQVDIAPDGKTAIDLFKQKNYDLIFMDIGLPDLTGYEVAKHIRLHELDSKTHVPIVALTAHASEENKKRCIDAGMNTILTKPLLEEVANDILATFIPCRNKVIKSETRNQKPKVDLPASDIKIIDFDVVKKVANNNEELMHHILNTFTDKLPNEIENIQKAYRQRNWEELISFIHKLNGGARYCGAVRLKEACNSFAEQIKIGSTEKLDKLYKAVLDEIGTLIDFLSKNTISSL